MEHPPANELSCRCNSHHTRGNISPSADKYRTLGQPIHLIGVEFSKVQRSVVGFEVERAG